MTCIQHFNRSPVNYQTYSFCRPATSTDWQLSLILTFSFSAVVLMFKQSVSGHLYLQKHIWRGRRLAGDAWQCLGTGFIKNAVHKHACTSLASSRTSYQSLPHRQPGVQPHYQPSASPHGLTDHWRIPGDGQERAAMTDRLSGVFSAWLRPPPSLWCCCLLLLLLLSACLLCTAVCRTPASTTQSCTATHGPCSDPCDRRLASACWQRLTTSSVFSV